MKMALIGYGKMGQMIEKVALSRGHIIVARMTSNHWDIDALLDAEVCLEFTRPDSVLENIRKIAELKKPIVIGTTGWHDKLESVRTIVEKQQIGVLYSPNFSIGINIMLEILAHASQMMNRFVEYDVAGFECHHKGKKDSPSGTAREMARTIEENMPRIDEVPFSSLRCGAIPGTHTVLFDSHDDNISITHQARNRKGFAEGAIQAAEWLRGKTGFYTFKGCLQEMFKKIGCHDTERDDHSNCNAIY